jgi:hypothetical protein
MIQQSNYFTQVSNIDYNKLPAALKEGYDTIKFGSKDHTTWDYLKDDPEFLKLYFTQLNKHIGEKSQIANSKSHASTVRQGSPQASSATDNKSPRKKAAKPKQSRTKSTSSKKVVPKKITKMVEKLPEEIRFIKRYVLLHEKVKTKHQILLFLNALQKAIVEKKIRKSSPFSKEIMYIQDKLVNLYNDMPEQAKIEVPKTVYERYKKMADSEKVMLSITYIKRFIGIHGKTNVKEKSKRLFDQMAKAVKQGKLVQADPYKDKLEKIYKALYNYNDGKTDAPRISSAALNGLQGLVSEPELFSKKKVLK